MSAALAATAMALTACTAGSGPEQAREPAATRTPSGEGVVVLEPVEQSAREDVPSALRDSTAPELPEPVVDPVRIRSGGPPPDGIPAIDQPFFEPASSVGWLQDEEAVLSFTLGEQTRAYPVQILMWHEIVNDTVDGVPVAVTYCPLCNTALAFDRRAADRLLTFGTSGRLYLSALVMYDRQTESLWSQVEGRAIAGVLTGTELERLPVSTVPWGLWREANPDGYVLSRDTGHVREYGRNPYLKYDRPDAVPRLLDAEPDDRLPAMERVVAFPGARDSGAVRLARLARERVVRVEVDGRPVVLFAAPGLASALDADQVAEGREVAATGAFSPVLDDEELSFTAEGETFVDDRTGTAWDLLGQAVDGRLAGRRLEPVPHVDTFWFAWAAFRPDAHLLGP